MKNSLADIFRKQSACKYSTSVWNGTKLVECCQYYARKLLKQV